jgi:hypothetical protein
MVGRDIHDLVVHVVIRNAPVREEHRVAIMIERGVRRVDDPAIGVETVSPVSVPPLIVIAMDPVVMHQTGVSRVGSGHIVDGASDVVDRLPGVVEEHGVLLVVLGRVVADADLKFDLSSSRRGPCHSQADQPTEHHSGSHVGSPVLSYPVGYRIRRHPTRVGRRTVASNGKNRAFRLVGAREDRRGG